MIKQIENIFEESISLQNKTCEELSSKIMEAGKLLSQSLNQGNKILVCGNGGSASDAQHFSSELVNDLFDQPPTIVRPLFSRG